MLNGALLAWEYHEVYFDMCGIEKRLQRQSPLPALLLLRCVRSAARNSV